MSWQLVVAGWPVSREGRSQRHLIETVTILSDRKIGFRSLTENSEMTTAEDCFENEAVLLR